MGIRGSPATLQVTFNLPQVFHLLVIALSQCKMPKASKPPKTCLCTCILYCRSPSTSGGTGSWVSRSTRINHRRDEKRLKHNQRRERVPIPPKTRAGRELTPAATIERIRGEFHWLSSWPVSSSTKPFVFLHHPISNGPYIPAVGLFETDLNTGAYALKSGHRSNFAYLFAETRYYRMIHILEQLEEYVGRGPLINVIKEEIIYLNHLKGVEWSRQRASASLEGIPIVNTGENCKLFYITCVRTYRPFQKDTFMNEDLAI